VNNFLKYSNSYGHLLISIMLILTGTILVLISIDGTIKGMGVWMITTASSYWFISSVAAHGPSNGNNNQPPQGGGVPDGGIAVVEVPQTPKENL
jgi:hypothetical protein